VTQAEPPRILVAGVGNIFLGDDAFGVEVARRLAETALPRSVRVLDVGIRSVHLAYELAGGGYDTAILIDLVSKGGEPGTLYVLEPDDDHDAPATSDGHAIQPAQILALVRRLGGRACRVMIVGCEPSQLDEVAGLSPVVEAAVDQAVTLVLGLVDSLAVAPAIPAGN
jgi:hydrogenase maturation protease